jgi:hypothetical protein
MLLGKSSSRKYLEEEGRQYSFVSRSLLHTLFLFILLFVDAPHLFIQIVELHQSTDCVAIMWFIDVMYPLPQPSRYSIPLVVARPPPTQS